MNKCAIIFFSFCYCASLSTAELQHVRFYQPSSSCQNTPNKTIYVSENNINGSHFSSMSLLGMWQQWACPSNNFNCGSQLTTYITNTDSCVVRSNPSLLYNFRMMGDANQKAAELYLYSMINFNGVVQKLTNTMSWSSSSTMSVQSFWFTGVHEWALFSQSNFKGTKTCLKPSTQVRNQGYGFTAETLGKNYTIKSAKLGCTGARDGANFLVTILIFPIMNIMTIKY